MTKLFQLACLSSLLFAIHNPVFAHYLWLEANPETSNRTALINIDIRVGDNWPGEPLANDLSQYEIFDSYQQGNSNYVSGERGRIPAGFIENKEEPFAIYYRSVKRSIVMQQADFLRHLVAEGLKNAFELYEKTGRPNEINETYTHHAVLLADRVTLPDNPELRDGLMLRPAFEQKSAEGQTARFRLTYQNQAIAQAPVTLKCADQSLPVNRQYTSTDGWVTFKRLCNGDSLLHSIYIRALDQTGSQWESHWLSLSLNQRVDQ